MPFLFVIVRKRERKEKIEKQKRKLHSEFMEALKIVSMSLQAGLSMENAWKEAEQEIGALIGTEGLFFKELVEMNHSVSLNIPIEKVVGEFAYRTAVEDIIQFAEVFSYGKRSGGNWKKMIEATIRRMGQKYETERQIEVLLAEKQMEQRVMSIIPLGMLMFMQLTAMDYMSVLYGNILGVICMTICLSGYVGAVYLAEKILKIQV